MAVGSSALLRFSNIAAFILTVLVNGLAGSTTIIGGRNTAEVSDSFPTLITPAGYVFAIWGVIYVLLGVFVVFQALPNEQSKDFRSRIGWLFIVSSLVNVVWLFLWQFELLGLSVVVMFVLLASLIAIYMRLGIGDSVISLKEKLAVHVPFSVYLGWITIASIANVSVWLVSANWDGFGVSRETWAALIITVAFLITLLVVSTRRDVAYGLVIIWALVGIAANQGGNQTVVMFAELGAAAVAIALAASILLSKLRNM